MEAGGSNPFEPVLKSHEAVLAGRSENAAVTLR
jgi:hypothetical protein